MPKSFVFVVYEEQKYKTGKNSWGRIKAAEKKAFKICASFSTKKKAEEFVKQKKDELREKQEIFWATEISFFGFVGTSFFFNFQRK